MATLYLWLNLGSFLVPFLFSFHPRIQFYKKWPSLFIGIAVMMAIFIPWDIVFTQQGYWGFNEAYLAGIFIFNLPLEEWLFFICIPYACVFTHYTLIKLVPNFKFGPNTTKAIYLCLATILIITLWYAYGNWYTLISFMFALLVLGIAYNYDKQIFPSFFATYLIILIPFFIVNGILTGSFIPEPVVWYNNAENLSFRLGTIPVEDTIYNLGMLLTVVLVTEYLERKKLNT